MVSAALLKLPPQSQILLMPESSTRRPALRKVQCLMASVLIIDDDLLVCDILFNIINDMGLIRLMSTSGYAGGRDGV